MFIFWGPFFFFFPLLIIYLVLRGLTGNSRAGRGFSHFGMPWDTTESSDHSLRVAVYKLAYRLKGTVTVSDIVVETGLDVEEAEKLIQSMVDHQRVRMEIKEDGMILYEFPEIRARYIEEERASR
jgi:hypothetical protein